jgi:hypothetical protein
MASRERATGYNRMQIADFRSQRALSTSGTAEPGMEAGKWQESLER